MLLISFSVATLFAHVWEISCDVILHCFCIDDNIQKAKGTKAKYPTDKLKMALKKARDQNRGQENLKDNDSEDSDYL